MFEENQIALKRFNGVERYAYTEGEYRYFIEGDKYVHNIEVFAEKPLQLLSDSVCQDCGGVHLAISIYSKNSKFSVLNEGLKFICSPVHTEIEEIIPYFVCCEHIELDNCEIEILKLQEGSIGIKITAKLWGPSYFGQDASKTELYFKGKIPFIEG